MQCIFSFCSSYILIDVSFLNLCYFVTEVNRQPCISSAAVPDMHIVPNNLFLWFEKYEMVHTKTQFPSPRGSDMHITFCEGTRSRCGFVRDIWMVSANINQLIVSGHTPDTKRTLPPGVKGANSMLKAAAFLDYESEFTWQIMHSSKTRMLSKSWNLKPWINRAVWRGIAVVLGTTTGKRLKAGDESWSASGRSVICKEDSC